MFGVKFAVHLETHDAACRVAVDLRQARAVVGHDLLVQLRQLFGIFEGEVASISKNVSLPQELPIPIKDLQDPVYHVTVALDSQAVKAYGKTLSLQPGMTLEADIILDRQTLFEWILDPIFSLKGRF